MIVPTDNVWPDTTTLTLNYIFARWYVSQYYPGELKALQIEYLNFLLAQLKHFKRFRPKIEVRLLVPPIQAYQHDKKTILRFETFIVLESLEDIKIGEPISKEAIEKYTSIEGKSKITLNFNNKIYSLNRLSECAFEVTNII